MPNGCGGAGAISKIWKRLTDELPPWEQCCTEHDLAYEQGGLAEWRSWADALLRDCMLAMGYPVRAWVYWAAVRLLGGSHWGTTD